MHIIAIGTAEGIVSLHDGCQQRIIHYNIKPENILLDVKFCPKTADFGLAKLCNREKMHMTLMNGRDSRLCSTRNVDVISCNSQMWRSQLWNAVVWDIGKEKNANLPESQEWFPKWVWKKLEKGEFQDLIIVCGIEKNDKEKAKRMALVALLRVQYKPEARPSMTVVKC